MLAASLAGCTSMSTPRAAQQPPSTEPAVLAFWLKPGASTNDPRFVATDGHPCGGVAMMAVTAIPQADAVIDVETFVEFDHQGRVLRQWRGPVDTEVVQVDADRVGIAWQDRAWWIDGDGRLYSRTPDKSPSRTIECPDLPMFHGSKYLTCFALPDFHTGRERLIAQQSICS